MAMLIIIIFILAGVHILYESVILPSIQLSIRYKLFSLRDKARNLLIEEKIDSLSYKEIEKSINNAIHFLPILNAAMPIIARHRFRTDDVLRARAMKSRERIERAGPEVINIADEVTKYFELAITYNSAMFFLYAIPVILPILILKHLSSTISKKVSNLKKILQYISYTSEEEIKQFAGRGPLGYKLAA